MSIMSTKLKKAGYRNLAVIFLLVSFFSFAFYIVFNDSVLGFLFLAVFFFSGTAVCFLLLSRYQCQQYINRMDSLENRLCEEIRNTAMKEYKQLEALIALHNLIDFKAPAPSFRGWPISPDFALLLASKILQIKSKNPVLIECGSGASTIVSGLILKMQGGGKIISFEHDQSWLLETRNKVELHGLTDLVDLVFAPLVMQSCLGEMYNWYDLSGFESEKVADLLVVDGPPGDLGALIRYPALPLLRPFLKADALILLDDAARPGEQEIVKRWVKDGFAKDVSTINTETGAVCLRLAD